MVEKGTSNIIFCGYRILCYDWWKKYNPISIAQGDDYTTGCLLDYPYFKKYYKVIKIDLSKQQKLDADPKAI